MPEDRQITIESESGAEIVNGLNIMRALTIHPKAKYALKDIIMQISGDNMEKIDQLFNDLETAGKWLETVNEKVQELGLKPE